MTFGNAKKPICPKTPPKIKALQTVVRTFKTSTKTIISQEQFETF